MKVTGETTSSATRHGRFADLFAGPFADPDVARLSSHRLSARLSVRPDLDPNPTTAHRALGPHRGLAGHPPYPKTSQFSRNLPPTGILSATIDRLSHVSHQTQSKKAQGLESLASAIRPSCLGLSSRWPPIALSSPLLARRIKRADTPGGGGGGGGGGTGGGGGLRSRRRSSHRSRNGGPGGGQKKLSVCGMVRAHTTRRTSVSRSRATSLIWRAAPSIISLIVRRGEAARWRSCEVRSRVVEHGHLIASNKGQPGHKPAEII